MSNPTGARAMSGALSAEAAIARVAAGGLIGFPTETLWGLGADARSEDALAGLRRWKGREAEKPISVLVAGDADLARLGARLTPAARRLADAFWPGPLTLVVRCETRLAAGVANPAGAVGLRCSPHPVAAALAGEALRRGVGPLTATSLNRAGEPACRTRAEAEALAGPALALVAGEDAGGAQASSVVDASGAEPVVLREGAVSGRAIAAALAGGRP
jgi:L-threonylcarbamoyladenylate synthase